jgi:hypothetical protein
MAPNKNYTAVHGIFFMSPPIFSILRVPVAL